MKRRLKIERKALGDNVLFTDESKRNLFVLSLIASTLLVGQFAGEAARRKLIFPLGVYLEI